MRWVMCVESTGCKVGMGIACVRVRDETMEADMNTRIYWLSACGNIAGQCLVAGNVQDALVTFGREYPRLVVCGTERVR